MTGSRSRGFTLVELAIVVGIIMIVAAILMIMLSHARDDANVASCESNERMIAAALDSYAVDHGGRFPPGGGAVDRDLFGGSDNPYFQQDALTDPASGLPYLYSNGPGTCANPDAEYQIIDQGGHASSSLVALLQADNLQDSVAFCSDRGLYAMQFGGVSAGAMNMPGQPGGPQQPAQH